MLGESCSKGDNTRLKSSKFDRFQSNITRNADRIYKYSPSLSNKIKVVIVCDRERKSPKKKK